MRVATYTRVTPVTNQIGNPTSLIPGLGRIRCRFQTNAKSVVLGAVNALVAAVFAPACAVCGALLDRPTEGCVCRDCWGAVLPITPPVCDRCGDHLARSDELCRICSGAQHCITRARALGAYEGTLRELIHALKYAGRVSLARPLAERMRQHGRELIDEVDGVVPVPLHWRREHQRGFNQAREIARYLGPPVVEVLRRCRATRPQVELAADRRRGNVAGAFAVRRQWCRGANIRGRKLLLVDDVSTTGATLESCARILKDSNASEVYALTAARVVMTRRQRIDLISDLEVPTLARQIPDPQSVIPNPRSAQRAAR
jgi:ComF family protein